MQQKDSSRQEETLKKLREANRAAEERLLNTRKENADLRRALGEKDALLGCLPQTLIVVQGGKIKEMNQRGLDALGYSLREVQGMHFTDLIHSSQRGLYGETFPGKKGGGPYEIQFLTKGGETVNCDAAIHKITYQGRSGFLAELASAEARKDRERQLIESLKDDLIAEVGSGFGRKLAPSVRVLEDHLNEIKNTKGGKSNSQRKWEVLTKATAELISLMRSFELLSSEGCGWSRAVLFDLGNVVEDAVSQMEASLKEALSSGAAIRLHCYTRKTSPVEGDPEELRDVMKGMIRNAVEAMPEGGDLYISAEENAGYACVYIQDSGSGIPEQILPRIMDPFFTTKGTDADGLGLCIARAVLRRHRGHLEVTTGKGNGTTVTLRLPLFRGVHKQGKACARKRKDTHILILEEDPLVRELLSQVVSSKGYMVEVAETMPEGFEKLRGKTFDMVIAGTVTGDIRKIIQRIRRMEPRACLALILEQGKNADGAEAERNRVDLVIGRPIDMTAALNRISEVLIGRAK